MSTKRTSQGRSAVKKRPDKPQCSVPTWKQDSPSYDDITNLLDGKQLTENKIHNARTLLLSWS